MRSDQRLVIGILGDARRCGDAGGFLLRVLDRLRATLAFDRAAWHSIDGDESPLVVDGRGLLVGSAHADTGQRSAPERITVEPSFHGAALGTLVITRASPWFRDDERALVTAALPAIGMALAAYRAGRAEPGAGTSDREGSADDERPQIDAFRRLFGMLSARQQEVALHLSRGHRNRDIALILGASPNTVRNHTVRIFERMQCGGRTELAAWIQRARVERPLRAAAAAD